MFKILKTRKGSAAGMPQRNRLQSDKGPQGGAAPCRVIYFQNSTGTRPSSFMSCWAVLVFKNSR